MARLAAHLTRVKPNMAASFASIMANSKHNNIYSEHRLTTTGGRQVTSFWECHSPVVATTEDTLIRTSPAKCAVGQGQHLRVLFKFGAFPAPPFCDLS